MNRCMHVVGFREMPTLCFVAFLLGWEYMTGAWVCVGELWVGERGGGADGGVWGVGVVGGMEVMRVREVCWVFGSAGWVYTCMFFYIHMSFFYVHVFPYKRLML